MRKVELLSPVGDFECLKAAVQNGANSVYLGASSFSARAKATNFDTAELLEAIKYAKLRNVSVHLALNSSRFRTSNIFIRKLPYDTTSWQHTNDCS